MTTKWSTIKHDLKVKVVYKLLVSHTTEPLVDLADQIVTFFERDESRRKKAKQELEELEEAFVREKAVPTP